MARLITGKKSVVGRYFNMTMPKGKGNELARKAQAAKIKAHRKNNSTGDTRSTRKALIHKMRANVKVMKATRPNIASAPGRTSRVSVKQSTGSRLRTAVHMAARAVKTIRQKRATRTYSNTAKPSARRKPAKALHALKSFTYHA